MAILKNEWLYRRMFEREVNTAITDVVTSWRPNMPAGLVRVSPLWFVAWSFVRENIKAMIWVGLIFIIRCACRVLGDPQLAYLPQGERRQRRGDRFWVPREKLLFSTRDRNPDIRPWYADGKIKDHKSLYRVARIMNDIHSFYTPQQFNRVYRDFFSKRGI